MDINIHLDTIEIILLSALFFFLIIQLVYYWVFLARPYYYLKKIKNEKIAFSNLQPPVSIIIYARSEAENLQAFLPSVLEQDYPEYEVIVVNDDSSDNSEGVLKRLQFQYSHLYYTYVPQGTKNLSREKLGFTLGIKAAKYDTLLFTKADCRPPGKDWIAGMTRHLSLKKTIIIGFCTLGKRLTLKGKFIAFDYYFANLQMVSMALLKSPYGVNGRNLAYRKEHFESQKGYSKYHHLQTGEEGLYINETATKDNIAVELSPESVVVTQWEDMYEWKCSKINRSIIGRFHKKIPIFLWQVEQWTRFLFPASFWVCLLYDWKNILLPLSAVFALIVRLFSQLFVVNKTAAYLKLEKYYFLFPFFEIMQPIVNLYFYIYRLFKGKIEI